MEYKVTKEHMAALELLATIKPRVEEAKRQNPSDEGEIEAVCAGAKLAEAIGSYILFGYADRTGRMHSLIGEYNHTLDELAGYK